MSRFSIGNVIKTKYNTIEIVCEVCSDGYTHTVFFDAQNASAGHRDKTYVEDEYCHCGMISCEYCRMGKSIPRTVYGMEDAELLAPTVKDWIIKSLTKGFSFWRDE